MATTPTTLPGLPSRSRAFLRPEVYQAWADHICTRTDWPATVEWSGFVRLFGPWWQLKHMPWPKVWWSENERAALNKRAEQLEERMRDRYPRRWAHLQLALRLAPTARGPISPRAVLARVVYFGMVAS